MSNSAQYSRDKSAILLTEIKMLWTIFVILGILWLLGFSFHVGGGLIHILLVIAVVVLIFNLLAGRRSV
jgi:hypothetical protein